MKRKCFACDRPLKSNPHHVVAEDGQAVVVGSECFKRVLPVEGYQPPKGGPRLYRARFRLDGFTWIVIARE